MPKAYSDRGTVHREGCGTDRHSGRGGRRSPGAAYPSCLALTLTLFPMGPGVRGVGGVRMDFFVGAVTRQASSSHWLVIPVISSSGLVEKEGRDGQIATRVRQSSARDRRRQVCVRTAASDPRHSLCAERPRETAVCLYIGRKSATNYTDHKPSAELTTNNHNQLLIAN
jgi:hypothetical protein